MSQNINMIHYRMQLHYRQVIGAACWFECVHSTDTLKPIGCSNYWHIVQLSFYYLITFVFIFCDMCYTSFNLTCFYNHLTRVTIVTTKYFKFLCFKKFHNFQCTNPSSINHTWKKLRQFSYILEMIKWFKDCFMQLCTP